MWRAGHWFAAAITLRRPSLTGSPEFINPGLWRIPLVSHSGLTAVNVYAVPAQAGWIVIDSGLPGSMEAFEESLAAAGIQLTGVRHILISHLHADHTGLAQSLRELSGAPVWMHRHDADLLRELKTSTKWHTNLELALRQSGVDGDTKAAAFGAWSRLIAAFAMLEPDRFLEEGTRFETAMGPLITLHTPGHSPGHCCFWAPESGVLFSGDLILEDATPHLAWHPGTDTVSCYLSSLERLGKLPASLVLPGHGMPATSAARVVKRDLRRRRTRLHAVEKMLVVENLAPAAVVGRLWPSALSPSDFQMAFSEVMAFREHLALR